MSNRFAALVESLRHPAAYPWQPNRVDFIETHVSWVFLAGERVVKVKRPVRYGFVDHRTIARRRHSCEEEVRLNRRLSEGVYLDTVAITRTRSGFEVAGSGRVVEWATLMRRLPADRMLDVLIEAGTTPEDLASKLADRLIPFHRDIAAPCGPADADPATSIAVVLDNLDELEAFAGRPLAARQLGLVTGSLRAFADQHRELIAERVAQGWVRDGHGDLRAEHVCIEPAMVQIFDCVEFSPAIRCADVASDLAYLLMDLDRLGAGDVAIDLVARYREAGLVLPGQILRFYRAHRALVRAKIACLTMSGGLENHPAAGRDAARYLDLATRAALTVRPFLVTMTGLSGTGKSTVAQALARSTGAHHLSSDIVRKQFADVTGPAPADYGQGIYAPEWSRQTYEGLLAAAGDLLERGRPVILDASFLESAWRERAVTLGRSFGVPVIVAETVVDREIAESRIRARAESGDSVSDATVEIYRRQRATFWEKEPQAIPGATWVRTDTAGNPADAVGAVLARLVENGAVVDRIRTS